MKNGKIRLGVVGVLGEVSVQRKIPNLLRTNLGSLIDLTTGVDIYDAKSVRSDVGCIVKYISGRFKSQISRSYAMELERSVLPRVLYHQVDKNNPLLPRRFFDDLDKSDKSFVDVSTPNEFHLPLLKQLIEHGRSIVIEKPIVRNGVEADDLEAFLAVRELNGNVVVDAEHYSYYGNVRQFIEHHREFSNGRYDLGMITGLDLMIEEDEDFSNARNQDVIRKNTSGGGMWLDTGIHAISFIRRMGAEIDFEGVYAQPFKSHDPHIQGNEFGETAMETLFYLKGNDYIEGGSLARISVGKCCGAKNKRFVVNYQRGKAEMDMEKKKLTVFDRGGNVLFMACNNGDAFYHLYNSVYDNIKYGTKPFTGMKDAIENVRDVSEFYERANPLRRLDRGHKYSAVPY
jgi:predicted dehydrogenase